MTTTNPIYSYNTGLDWSDSFTYFTNKEVCWGLFDEDTYPGLEPSGSDLFDHLFGDGNEWRDGGSNDEFAWLFHKIASANNVRPNNQFPNQECADYYFEGMENGIEAVAWDPTDVHRAFIWDTQTPISTCELFESNAKEKFLDYVREFVDECEEEEEDEEAV